MVEFYERPPTPRMRGGRRNLPYVSSTREHGILIVENFENHGVAREETSVLAKAKFRRTDLIRNPFKPTSSEANLKRPRGRSASAALAVSNIDPLRPVSHND